MPPGLEANISNVCALLWKGQQAEEHSRFLELYNSPALFSPASVALFVCLSARLHINHQDDVGGAAERVSKQKQFI